MKFNWAAGNTGHIAEHNTITNRLINVLDYGAVGNGSTDDTTAFQAAIDAAAVAGGTVRIPAGNFKITTLTLANGITIRGETPSLVYVEGIPADLSMQANGETWLDCSAGVGMIGSNIRGLHISGVGLKNFSKMMVFGGDGVEGVSFTMLENIFGIGITTVNASDIAIENYNFERFHISCLHVANVNTLLRLGVQNNYVDPGNSIFDDIYVYTYAKSAANENNTKAGIEILGLVPTNGPTSTAIDLLTFIRPQVNSFNGDGTGIGIKMLGNANTRVYEVNLIDADIEGPLAYTIYMEYVRNCKASIMTSPSGNVPMYIGEHVEDCIFESYNPGTAVENNSTYRNMFYGFFTSISANPKGLITDTSSGLLKLFTNHIRAISFAEHADNTAALAGGLVAGDFYRTGDLVKVVHA